MVYRFTDVVIDSRTGLNPRKNFVLGSGDNYYITIKDIYNGKVNFTDKTDKVDDEAIQIIKRRSRIKVGDVLFVSIGRIGETAIVMNKDDSWDVNESVFVFTLNNKIITPEYFCTMFQSQGVKQYLSGNSSGSTFKSIKVNQLERMTFDIPPVTTQKSITTKLTAVRRIIDLRTSQLAELDNLVKARFIELFGTETEFDKWPCCTIGDVADVCVGVVIKPTQYYTDTGIPAFRSLNIGEMHVKDSDWVYFTEEGHQKNQKSVVHKNDVLVVRSGAPGTACVATEKYDGYNAVDIIIAHPDNSKVNSIFLAAFTNMPHGMNQIRERTGGAAQQHFNVGGYKAMRLIMPSIELQNQYAAFVEQTDKSKVTVQKALDEAQLLFDSLMQKYFG